MSLNKSEVLRIAEQRIHQGQTSEAIAIYKKIIEADPFDLTTIGALSNLYVKTGRIQDAIDDFSRIAEGYLDKGSPIKSAYILKKILELDPRNAPAHMRLGEIYAHEGMSEKAYEAFLAAGALFVRKGNLADALEANKKALAVKPDSQQATAAIASLQDRTASPTSERLSSQAPSDDPDRRDHAPKPASSGHTHAGFDDGVVVQKLSMAEFLVSYGKVEQAIALLKEILDHRPDHIDVRVKLKDIYLRSEMMGKASSECFEIASIYAARGDAARARDYTVRAERLTQLFKQTDSLRGVAFDKDEPQSSSSNGGALTGKAKPETSGAASRLQPIKEQAASSQEKAASNQKRAASNQEKASLKAAPVAVAIQSPAAPLKLIVEKTELAEPPKADKLEMQPGDTALALVTKEERSLAMVTNSALVVSNSFPLTTLGILSAQPVIESATKKKSRRWLYAAMIAFAVLAAIAVAVFKGARMYEARLDREYQTLEQSISLPSLPQPPDSAPVEESGPVEQVEVRASDSPSPQPNKPVRPDEETQPTRNAETQPQPSPAAVTASEPPKVNKPSSPAPPLISSTPSPQGGVESATPGGVPTGMPTNTAGLPEPPPPPAAASRKPGAMIRGESIKQVQPGYPPLAKSTGQSGVVAVEVTISEKGDVISARALSGPPLLRDAAVSAAKRWKFKPSTRDSKPVVSVSTISFKFTM